MNSIITNPPSILTPTQQSNIATYGNPTGIKSYVALLTQTGTDAPVATVLENTLGGTVVWTRGSAGVYVGTLAAAFTTNKTFIYGINQWFRQYLDGDGAMVIKIENSTADVISINQCVSYADDTGVDSFNSIALEVLVYP